MDEVRMISVAYQADRDTRRPTPQAKLALEFGILTRNKGHGDLDEHEHSSAVSVHRE